MITWKRSAILSAGILSIMLAGPTRAWGQEACSAPLGTIEVLAPNGFSHSGNTCDFPDNNVSFYDSQTCRIPRVNYPGGDVVYKVRLNAGNEVAFFLDVQGSADLMLALVKTCGDGNTCVTSSTDFIGSGDEEISAAKYEPGIYYLYIDSALNENGQIACGPYQITVSGVNPVPDLVLDLTASPARAIAGRQLTYTLLVTNRGTLTATGVVIKQTLPQGTTFTSSDNCTVSDENKMTVRCDIQSLPAGEWSKSTVTVHIDPATRNHLTSTAEVTANEGLSTRDEVTTSIAGESDLSISLESNHPKDPVVAGQSLAYTFTVRNAGPSEANHVKVTDTLDGEEVFANASEGCSRGEADGDRTVACQIEKILPGKTVKLSMTVNVRPSAPDGYSLVNKATVVADEKEPARNRGPNSATVTTPVKRVTDLAITIKGPADSVPFGDELIYDITVKNIKNDVSTSDSTGAKVMVDLASGLLFENGKIEGCIQPEVSDSNVVTCQVGSIPSGGEHIIILTVRTRPSFRTSPLRSDASVAAFDEDTDPNNNNTSVSTSFRILTNLEITKTAAKASDPMTDITSICAGENILYTIKATNSGPSFSKSGMILDVFPAGLSFVSAADDCTFDAEVRTITCPLLNWNVNESHTIRFVAEAPSEVPGPIMNTASVTGNEEYPHTGKADSAIVSTEIVPATDLALTLSASPDPVKPGESLTYTLEVTNHGRSTAASVTVDLTLPVLPLSEPRPDCAVCDFPQCSLDLGIIDVDGARSVMICALAPATPGMIMASATVKDRPCDPADNNKSEVTTTVAGDNDADLSLTMTADKVVVTEGDLLSYTIAATNRGFAPAQEVTIVDTLPAGVMFDSGPGCGIDAGNPLIVTCDIGTLEVGAEQAASRTVTVTVGSSAERLLSNEAIVTAKSNDPN